MTPLKAILSWWEALDDPPRSWIAADVCLRLIPGADVKQAEASLRSFLENELAANWHVGRVLAVRAVVDYWFMRDRQRDPAADHLESVEGSDVELKSLANAALGRMPEVRKAVEQAFERWQHVREGAISDDALVSAERDAMLQWIQKLRDIFPGK
jgi:hypothetical protein